MKILSNSTYNNLKNTEKLLENTIIENSTLKEKVKYYQVEFAKSISDYEDFNKKTLSKLQNDKKILNHKLDFAIKNHPKFKIGETISGKTIQKIDLEFRKKAFIEGMVVIGAKLFCDVFKGKPSKIKTLDVNKEINKIKKFEYVYEIKCSCGKIETLTETELEKLLNSEK